MNMLAKRKTMAVMGIVLLAAGLLYLAFQFWLKPADLPADVAPSVQFLESKLIGRKGGERQWEIVARSVLQEGDLVTLREVESITLFQAAEPHLDVGADLVTWRRTTDILQLHGNASVERRGEFQLRSDYLVWDNSTASLTSPGPVGMSWSGLDIRAGQMNFDSNADLLYLEDDVVIRDGDLRWNLERAVYDLNRDVLEFYGGIVLDAKAGADYENQ